MKYLILAGVLALLGCAHRLPVGNPPSPMGTATWPEVEASKSRLTVSPLFFGLNVDTLTKTQKSVLKRVALKANAYGQSLDIVGYADTSGSTAYNMALGRRRASSVKLWLTLSGCLVPLSIASYGEVPGIPAWSRKVTIKAGK